MPLTHTYVMYLLFTLLAIICHNNHVGNDTQRATDSRESQKVKQTNLDTNNLGKNGLLALLRLLQSHSDINNRFHIQFSFTYNL